MEIRKRLNALSTFESFLHCSSCFCSIWLISSFQHIAYLSSWNSQYARSVHSKRIQRASKRPPQVKLWVSFQQRYDGSQASWKSFTRTNRPSIPKNGSNTNHCHFKTKSVRIFGIKSTVTYLQCNIYCGVQADWYVDKNGIMWTGWWSFNS